MQITGIIAYIAIIIGIEIPFDLTCSASIRYWFFGYSKYWSYTIYLNGEPPKTFMCCMGDGNSSFRMSIGAWGPFKITKRLTVFMKFSNEQNSMLKSGNLLIEKRRHIDMLN